MHICYVAGIFRYLDFVHMYTGVFKNAFFPPLVSNKIPIRTNHMKTQTQDNKTTAYTHKH